MNRYSDYSVSKYDPLSFQEIASVPMMKRQEHNKMVEQLELLNSSLGKVDPLDVHFNEAVSLKNEIQNKISNMTSELSQKGFNNDMTGKILSLNKEYNNLYSPTGRIGKINAAKIAEAAEYKKFIDSPELKDYGLDAKENAWKEHRAKYKGYDEKGNIVNISSLSGPKYEDMQKDFMDLSSRLGETTKTYLKNIGAHFQPGPFGGLVMVSGDGKTIDTNNDANLKALAETMSSKYIDPQGSGYKSRKFAGYDLKNTIEQLNGLMGIPRVDKQVKDMNYNYNFINDPNAKSSKETIEPASDAIYDNTTVENLDKNIKEVDFSQIGNTISAGPVTGTPFLMGSEGSSKLSTTKQTYKDVLKDPLSQKMYEKSYKTLISKGVLPKTADLNDNKYAQIIGKYMQENIKIPTLGHNIIKAATTPSEQMFMGATSKKDHNEMQNSLVQDLRGDEKHAPSRMMVDLDTGKQIYLEPGQKISYVGFDSPVNYVKHGFKSSSQNVAAHRAQILDSDGNFIKNVAISRTRNEQETPQFRQMYDINRGYRNAVENLGDFVPLDGKYSGSKQIKDFYLKFTEDGKFILKRKGFEESEPMSSPEFQEQMRQILAK